MIDSVNFVRRLSDRCCLLSQSNFVSTWIISAETSFLPILVFYISLFNVFVQVVDQWSGFKQKGKHHQKVLEYRIPSLEANKLMGQSQQCLHDISQSLAEGEYDDKLWQLLHVSYGQVILKHS